MKNISDWLMFMAGVLGLCAVLFTSEAIFWAEGYVLVGCSLFYFIAALYEAIASRKSKRD